MHLYRYQFILNCKFVIYQQFELLAASVIINFSFLLFVLKENVLILCHDLGGEIICQNSFENNFRVQTSNKDKSAAAIE